MRKLANAAWITCGIVAMSAHADVVVHYSFDSGFEDESGNGNTAIVYDDSDNGTLTITAGSAVFGDGGLFDGEKNDRIDLTTPFAPVDSTPWTVAFFADLSGGAAAYGFGQDSGHAIQARADAENAVTIIIDGTSYVFESAGILSQNSDANHFVVVAMPEGVDLDGVAGDDRLAIYVNGQLLIPRTGQDLTSSTVSTALVIDSLGDAAIWPEGSVTEFDEFWILDHALNTHAVETLRTQNHPGALWYVNQNTPAAEDAQDGLSWDTAFADLQDAIAVSGEGDMLWVANGTYYPVTPVDPANPTDDERRVSFAMKARQKWYGGFAGNESSIDIPFNPGNVKLSGDLGNDDLAGGNSFHVVTVESAEDCLLNGFIFREGGDAEVNDADDRRGGGLLVVDSDGLLVEECEFRDNWSRNGAGMYVTHSEVTVRSCEFDTNVSTTQGGGIHSQHTIADVHSLVVEDCLFRDNQGGAMSGAVGLTYTNYTFDRCVFEGNSADNGGALRIYRSSGYYDNCLFDSNQATSQGGAIHYPNGGNFYLRHVTMYGNTAGSEGHAIYTTNSTTHYMQNSVIWYGDALPASGDLWHNETASVDYGNSMIQGVDLSGVSGQNLDGTLATHNPEFTDADGSEFDVRAYSPLVNAAGAIAGIETDLAGNSRVAGETADIGCYEHEDPFELGDALEYRNTQVGESSFEFDFVEALDSEDDSITMSSSDPNVATIQHPGEEGDLDSSIGEVTVVGLGSAEIYLDFQYKGGVVHRFVQSVTVSVTPLDERDLSPLTDLAYSSSDIGVADAYVDLSVIFDDSPDSFVVSTGDTAVASVSEVAGAITVTPEGFGETSLTMQAHYSDGTVLEVVRVVEVSVAQNTLDSLASFEPQGFGVNGDSDTHGLIDLSSVFSDGVSSIEVSSSDDGVLTVSENLGLISIQAQGSGESDVTITLIYANGSRYEVTERMRILDVDGELLAHYEFTGNTTDSQGSFDAETSAEGVTLDSDSVVTGELGMVSAPTELSSWLFNQDNTLQWNVDFTIEAAAEDGIKMLAALKNNNSSAPRAGGVMLGYNEDADADGAVPLYFSFADGVSSDHYKYTSVATCEIGKRYSVKMIFDIDRDVWSVQVIEDGTGDEQFANGEIQHHEDYQYDFSNWKSVVQAAQWTLGGFDAKNAQDALEESELRIHDAKIYSPALAQYHEVNTALASMTDHLNEVALLSDAEQEEVLSIVQARIAYEDYDKIQTEVEAYMAAYGAVHGAVFPTDTQVSEDSLTTAAQLQLLIQQWILTYAYTGVEFDLVSGYVFEDGKVFPGEVAEAAPRVASATVVANGNYSTDPDAAYIWAENVLRPLGYYVAAGDTVTVEVDPAFIGYGMEIVVGAHCRDLDPDKKPNINRFRNISIAYPLDAASIEVANPMGGAMYLRVLDGTNAGAVSLTVKGAVKSAYYSAREAAVTDSATWLSEVASSSAPWVDFESDKFMFSVPLSMAQEVTDPAAVMAKWDSIMDQYRFMNGRPADGRIRAEYYLLDRMLVTPAWGAGYPLVVPVGVAEDTASDWNPCSVLTVAPNRTLFHEFGHNCAIPGPVFEGGERELASGEVITLGSWAEGENLVNLPAAIIYSREYGYTLDEAFSSATHQPLSVEEAAMDWLITENFRLQQQIGLDTTGVFDINNNNATDELRYQARGIGRYASIAQVFGWEGLNLIQQEFYPIRDEDSWSPDGKRHRLRRDALIRRASEALEVNMAPLFHLWGIHPSDELKAELSTYPKHWGIKNLLEYYINAVPSNLAEYQTFRDEVYDKVSSYHHPRYDYYDSTLLTDADVQVISNIITDIVEDYGLDVSGEEPSALAVRHRPDGRVLVTWEDTCPNETGFVVRAKAAGSVTSFEVARVGSNATTAVTDMALSDGAYTFSVAAIYGSGEETLPGELEVDSLPSDEGTNLTLTATPYSNGFFTGSMSTVYQSGGSSGGPGIEEGTRLNLSAAAILDAIRTASGDDSIDYTDVQLTSVVVNLPSGMVSGPSIVEILDDGEDSYDAYAGGVNTTGNAMSFEVSNTQLDIVSLFGELAEGRDFDFFLYNRSPNYDTSADAASLILSYEVVGGYRHWTEINGLTPDQDDYSNVDADGDGYTNLEEYAFGRKPSEIEAGAPFEFAKSDVGDGMKLSFPRARSMVRYMIESSDDLSEWTLDWDSNDQNPEMVPVGEQQELELPKDGARRFYRLKVEALFSVEELT